MQRKIWLESRESPSNLLPCLVSCMLAGEEEEEEEEEGVRFSFERRLFWSRLTFSSDKWWVMCEMWWGRRGLCTVTWYVMCGQAAVSSECCELSWGELRWDDVLSLSLALASCGGLVSSPVQSSQWETMQPPADNICSPVDPVDGGKWGAEESK